MNRRPRALALAILLIAAIACNVAGSAASPTPASLPFPTETLLPAQASPTSPQPLAGTPQSFGGTNFMIPEGLATGAAAEIVAASSDTSGAPWDVHPAYTQFTLQGYPLQGTLLEPQISVYPVKEFSQLHEGAAATIVSLETLLANPATPLPSQLPFLPPFNAAQLFTAQPAVLQFQNGSGIRYLTEFAQYPATANNHDLFYTFQGLTSDGSAYVVAILPINASFLAADEKPDSPVPPDGIAFDQSNPQQYYSAVVGKLNGTPADAYTPSLTALDALVQSISASGQQ